MAEWYESFPEAPATPKMAHGPDPQAGAEKSGGNWWEAYPEAGPTKLDEQQASIAGRPSITSLLGNVGAGANRSIAGVLGMPGNLGAAISNTVMRQFGMPEMPNSENPATSAGMEKVMGADKFQPRNTAERMADAGGKVMGALPFMLLGGQGILGAAPEVAGAGAGTQITQNLLKSTLPKTGGELADITAGSLAAGVTGEGLKEAAPEGLKPLAETTGQLLGGGAYALGSAGTKQGVDALGKTVDDFVKPFTRGGQQQLAAEKILGASTDPEALRRTLNKDPEILVPGSNPTLAEVANDRGVTQWQDAMRSKNRGDFLQRQSEQNVARNESISGLAGEGADSFAVGKFFTKQLDDLEQQGAAATAGARGQVQSGTEKLGGFGRPEEYGATIRSEMETSAKGSKDKLKSLWGALKPYDDVKINGAPIQQAVKTILGGVREAAGQQASDPESILYNAVGNWAEHPTFGVLRDLRSEISAAQRELRFKYGDESNPMRRIGMLKTSVDQSIENTVKGIADEQAQQINQGRMAHDESLGSVLARWQQEWLSSKDAAADVSALNQRVTARTGGGFGPTAMGPTAAEGSQAVPGLGGAKGPPSGQPSGAAGSEGIPGAPAAFDEAAQRQYASAREATVEHKGTFRQGPVGDVLAAGRAGAEYRTPDSSVAGKFFNSKDSSPESLKAFIKSVGDKPAAVQALQDSAVADLRAHAINPDGTIDARRFDAWAKRHDRALSHFPELKKQLGNIQKAQGMLDDARLAEKESVKAFNKSRAANFIGSDPVEAVARTFAGRDSVKTQKAFADLVQKVKGDPEASEGMKRAVADYILKRVRGKLDNDETGLDLYGPKRFRQFVDTHKESLKTIFGGQGLNNLERVAMDMRRSSEATTGAKLGGQSNTTQDRMAAEKYGTQPNVLKWLVDQLGTVITGSVARHVDKTGVGRELLKRIGVTNVEALQLEAALNPEFARILLQKMPAKPTIPFQKRLAADFIKATTPALALDVTKGEDEKRRPMRVTVHPSDKKKPVLPDVNLPTMAPPP